MLTEVRARDPVGFSAYRWQHAGTVSVSANPFMSLKDWISRFLPGDAQPGSAGAELGTNLAVAALMVEVLRADYDVGPT